MFGAVAHMRVTPGMESEMEDLGKEFEGVAMPGQVATYLIKSEAKSGEYFLVVVTDSKESYFAASNSPEQEALRRKMFDLLAEEPEWSGGDVVYSVMSSGARIG